MSDIFVPVPSSSNSIGVDDGEQQSVGNAFEDANDTATETSKPDVTESSASTEDDKEGDDSYAPLSVDDKNDTVNGHIPVGESDVAGTSSFNLQHAAGKATAINDELSGTKAPPEDLLDAQMPQTSLDISTLSFVSAVSYEELIYDEELDLRFRVPKAKKKKNPVNEALEMFTYEEGDEENPEQHFEEAKSPETAFCDGTNHRSPNVGASRDAEAVDPSTSCHMDQTQLPIPRSTVGDMSDLTDSLEDRRRYRSLFNIPTAMARRVTDHHPDDEERQLRSGGNTSDNGSDKSSVDTAAGRILLLYAVVGLVVVALGGMVVIVAVCFREGNICQR